MQVTIKDIARKLGISPSTVSRALKKHPDISEETRKAVNQLAAELKYQPNAVALSLKQSRSNTVGVIIPELVHYFFSSVISGIEDVAYDAGFTVMICQSNELYDREVANTRALQAHRVDGLLVSVSKETREIQHFEDLRASNIPIVFFDRIIPGFSSDQIIIDDFEAAYRATCHLIEGGRKRIIHFAGPQSLEIGRQRMNGFLKAIKEAGLPVQYSVVEADDFEKARTTVLNLFDTGKIPDGIFAVNDLTAVGAMQTLQKKGFKIPEEVGIVGFSDGSFSGITDPALTSVDQHGYEMGTIAAEMLLKRIAASDRNYPFETKVLKTNLIIRGSSISV